MEFKHVLYVKLRVSLGVSKIIIIKIINGDDDDDNVNDENKKINDNFVVAIL